ncbi:hypothetical protein ACOMHN_036045 [Nucella lapillus]
MDMSKSPQNYSQFKDREIMRGDEYTTEGRLYREKLRRFNPEGYTLFKNRQKEACRRYRERRRLLKDAMANTPGNPESSGNLLQ